MMKRLLILGLMLLLIGPLHADSNQDTATELAQTIVPVHDRIELARRLLGVTEIAPPPTSSPTWHLGDKQTFWVTNEYEDREYQVEASLRSIGDHIYFWVQSDVNIDLQVLDQLASIFDRKIYEPLHALWGSEASPGIDGDPRIYGLFAFGQGPGIAAYFSNVNTFPVEAVKSSNEHEMFFFNLDTLGTAFAPEDVAGTVAHEFQHMIQDNLDGNETSWLNEGFSVFTERYTGYLGNGLGSALTFLAVPGTQLNTWPEDVYSRRQHYGAGLMFVSYFYDRYGKDALHALANNTDPGLQSVDEVLQSLGEPDANHFFADWVLANFLQDPTLADGRYGYRSLPVLASPPPVASPQQFPYTLQSSANQYSTDYVVLNPAASVTSLDIRLNAPSTVSLVPTDAPSGKMMWYSNRADYSDTRLTQRFDLHEVEQATLNFKLWYSIENLWDYGYVMVSTDEGQTWTPLETPQMTRENPHNNAYGPGYTGLSDGWLDQSVSLDAYAGQEILLRFEMITDEGTNQPGMLIDDVSIPEIGYASDFESGDGGWQAEGWIRTDNVLPQQVWVQAVQRVGKDISVSRWLAPDQTHWTLPLVDHVDQVILAVSPFSPVTTVPMPYTLDIRAGDPQA